jgi:hypothetical protein
MDHASSLKLAIDLMHSPSRAHSIRSAPLSDDVLILLRIVSGDEQAISEAVHSEGRSRETVREAAAFFIEQILLDPGADSYRVLGGKSGTPYHELRRNMALLLKWLHPDGDRQNQRGVFAARVTRAWNDLKTQKRRESYDCSRHPTAPKVFSPSHSGRSHRFGRRPLHNAPSLGNKPQRHPFNRVYPHEYGGFLRRVLRLVSGWSGLWR